MTDYHPRILRCDSHISRIDRGGILTSLEKAFKILTLFSEDSPAISVSDIAFKLHFPISTAYRYISTLKQTGFIEEADVAGMYHLGTAILDLAQNVPRKRLQDIALPFMQQLCEQTGETIVLSALRGQQGVCLEKVEGRHALRVSYERGAIFPLHAGASGKILMASLDRRAQHEIIAKIGLPRFSKTTTTDPDRLLAELTQIRKDGYALSNGEVIQGTFGIGAPIMSRTKKTIASLSLSAPTHRLEGKKRQEFTSLVVRTGEKISERLQAQEV